MKRIPGARVLYELQPGEDGRVVSGVLVIVHPDRPPKIVDADGVVDLREKKG
jgi:hypothetical protein